MVTEFCTAIMIGLWSPDDTGSAWAQSNCVPVSDDVVTSATSPAPVQGDPVQIHKATGLEALPSENGPTASQCDGAIAAAAVAVAHNQKPTPPAPMARWLAAHSC